MSTKPLIAIIDDDESVRAGLQSLVRSAGFTAEVFASASEFLASPHSEDAACLILDLNMPVMNGFELHRHLLDSGRTVPTILITGNPPDRKRAQTMYGELVDCLEKPFGGDVLLVAIEAALNRAKPR